jgi:uncharacterized protein YyaL (SSP411 family)
MTDLHFSPRPNRAAEIDWQPWAPETFARATILNRPILLSISAVWCHWCHVMDETSYSDETVIATIREKYVAIRVDNDERPDVNARYNMGGWPTTAFLAPDGMTITGATYLPAIEMRRALDEIAGFYATNRDQIAQRALELRDRKRGYQPAVRSDLTLGMIEPVVASLFENYDPQYGGFGEAPKFPQTEVHEFLLGEYRATGDERLLEIVTNTLQHMASGGTYDHVEGGFFRYSTTRDWSVPHFEKMAEDHAGLLRICAALAATTDAPWVREALRTATAYIRTVLRDEATGFFAGSQDADEEYFALPLDARRTKVAPYVDRRNYSNWTAGLASAFFAVARALDDDAFARDAIAALDGLHERMLDGNGFLFHVLAPGQPPAVRGLLTDQVAYTRALLDAHEHTGEDRFLTRAIAIADRIHASFEAPDGGFFDHAGLEDQIGNLTIADRPIGENGTHAESLLRLAALTGEARFHQGAERALLLFAKTYAAAGSFAATYCRALRRLLSPERGVRLVGSPGQTAGLRAAALALDDPLLTVRTVASEQAQALGLPAASGTAYLCAGTACGAPVADPAGLAAARETLLAGAP